MLTPSKIGHIHLASAVVSLVLGTIILIQIKGNRVHKQLGYVYVFSMLLLNGTSLCIYRLFGGWGPFHYAAILSLTALAMGILPALARTPGWKRWHVAGMYWSVIGLYAAFVSEVFTRIPGVNFALMVGLGTTAVMLAGGAAFRRNGKRWMGTGE